MLTLNRDDTDQFIASVTIGGSTGSEKRARLILDFGERKIMFEGSFSDNRVTVEIPNLMDINENSGIATLEVIADRTFFEAYTSEFELVNKKSVEVDEVSVARSEPIEVTVEDINLETREEEAVEGGNIYLESCSTRNLNVAQRFIDKHDKKDKLIDEFSDAVRTWGTDVFVDINSSEAIVAMNELEKKLAN